LNYIDALKVLHRVLSPTSYCEIGCRLGHSLALAQCPSTGIDPDFEITAGLSAPVRLFRMTSDEFFMRPDVAERLTSPPDFAFIDGLHQVEFALRDFINLERNMSRDGVIAIDDVLPGAMEYATRTRNTRIWTGDIYRLVLVLRHYRPDLDIRIYDVEMKGLAVVSGLDPESTVLSDAYKKIEIELAAGKWSCLTVEDIRQNLSPKSPREIETDFLKWKRAGGAQAGVSLTTGDQPAHQSGKPDNALNTPSTGFKAQPKLSVIICTYNMPREAARTLLSAVAPYQRNVSDQDYEVIVVDNGSTTPLSTNSLPGGVKIYDMPTPSPSPVFAMNWAAREIASGQYLLMSIDGARIFSQGIYREIINAHRQVEDAFVYTLGWHLGPKVQMQSIKEGYNQEVEDALLARSGWPEQADAIYDISTFAGSSLPGFFNNISESNAFSISRSLFDEVGGYDERFVSPGGGLANLELFARYVSRPAAKNVCLLGEGTFHQVHGGAATSGKVPRNIMDDEYLAIFGRSYQSPRYDRLYYGRPCASAVPFVRQSLDIAVHLDCDCG